ncbi:DMT family transporter [bacterium]|nr:DMT family transporter [bacterium]
MDLSGIPYIGEMFALGAPLCWAFAVILFRWAGQTVPPFTLNLFKNVVGLLLGVVTVLAMGDPLWRSAPLSDYWILIGSGIIGIGISDLLFFMALNRVGAGLWSIINTSYSPSIIFMAILFLGESLAPVQWFGVALILSAVLAVTWMRGPKGEVPKKTVVVGVLLGITAMLTQAVSVIMVKPLLESTDLMWNFVWRLLGGLGFMLVILPFRPDRLKVVKSFGNVKDLTRMLPGTFLGTYLSLMLWLGGMKYAKASVASVLNQTSSLFIFVLAVLLLKEPATKRRIAGLIVGIAGVALVTFGG